MNNSMKLLCIMNAFLSFQQICTVDNKLRVENNSVYDIYVGFVDNKGSKKVSYIEALSTKKIPLKVIEHRVDPNVDLVKIILRAVADEKSNGSYSEHTIVRREHTFRAPKGAFNNLEVIKINYSRYFTWQKDGQFSIDFVPPNNDIQMIE